MQIKTGDNHILLAGAVNNSVAPDFRIRHNLILFWLFCFFIAGFILLFLLFVVGLFFIGEGHGQNRVVARQCFHRPVVLVDPAGIKPRPVENAFLYYPAGHSADS